MFLRFLATALLVTALGDQALAKEFIDPDNGTVYEITVPFSDFRGKGPLAIHKCGGSSFMVGAHVKNNVFVCEDGADWFGPSSYQITDVTANAMQPKLFERYVSHDMAACPPGMAMVGLHHASNVLLCAPLRMTELIVDSRTTAWSRHREEGLTGLAAQGVVGWGIHRCPKGFVLVGIHEARDLLLCGRVSIAPR